MSLDTCNKCIAENNKLVKKLLLSDIEYTKIRKKHQEKQLKIMNKIVELDKKMKRLINENE